MSFSDNRPRNKLLLILGPLLLGLLLIAGTTQSWLAQKSAETRTVENGKLLLQQTSLLANPLLLANDRVSLNYLLNELTTLPWVRAAQLKTDREGVVARAGDPAGIEMAQALSNRQDSHLSIWLDPAPLAASLFQQLQISALFALAALLAIWITISRVLRPSDRPRPADSHSAAATEPAIAIPASAALEPDPLVDALPPAIENAHQATQTPQTATFDLTADTAEPAEATEEYPASSTQAAQAAPPAASSAVEPEEIPFDARFVAERQGISQAEQAEAEPLTPPAIEPEPRKLKDEGDLQAFISAIATGEATTPEERPDLPADIPYIGGIERRRDVRRAEDRVETTEPAEKRNEPTLDTDSLVSLLKPEQPDQSIPQFQPSGPLPDTADTSNHHDDAPEFEEQTLSRDNQPGPTAAKSATENPLHQLNHRQKPREEQLSLYSVEHELELALNAEDAGYCLYIDASAAHAGHIAPQERELLLKLYTRLAGQTAALYNGNIAELASGDMFIRFDRALPDDSHGINALCASVLFNLLYKGFNQSQIRSFQPALNLRMALARGQRKKNELLLEEARFLTHTTQSNDLISHTALTETSTLQEKLLQQADIRREDEDKVLIMGLSGGVQNLLEKQCDQLLRKLRPES